MRAVPDEYYFDFRSFDGHVARKLVLPPSSSLTTSPIPARSACMSLSVSVCDCWRTWLRSYLGCTRWGSRSATCRRRTSCDGSRLDCFLIDCDAMRVNGCSVLPQAETPDWQIPVGEEKGTASSDAYKLALLAVRVFARNQTSRDPGALPATAEPRLGELAHAALLGQRDDRPAPIEWAEYCLSAAYSPGLVITARVSSPSGTPADAATAANPASAAHEEPGSPQDAAFRRRPGR